MRLELAAVISRAVANTQIHTQFLGNPYIYVGNQRNRCFSPCVTMTFDAERSRFSLAQGSFQTYVVPLIRS